MRLLPLIAAGTLALVTAGPTMAAVVTPTTYDTNNGDGQASGGNFNYWDKAYSGSGSTTTDNASLSGGLGDLTDGVVTSLNWFSVENSAGTGPYVGWRQPITPAVAVRFNFAPGTSIDAIHIHADDSQGAGGVSLPSTVKFTWDSGSTATINVVDPDASADPTWLDFTGLGIVGASFVTVSIGYGNEWIFVDEVKFEGTVAGIPEPQTYALMLAGLAVLAAAAKRRR